MAELTLSILIALTAAPFAFLLVSILFLLTISMITALVTTLAAVPQMIYNNVRMKQMDKHYGETHETHKTD